MPKRSSLIDQNKLEILQYLSGFQMVWRPFCFYHLKAGSDIFLTSLDRFVMNKIFFMTFLFIKRSRLATIRNPDFWVRLSNGPAIECPGPA
jgi:hypothetical protein